MRYSLSEKQINSFRDQQYASIVIQPGFEIYRFCKGRDLKFSDFWMDKESMKDVFRNFGNLIARSKTSNYNFSKTTVANIAVRHTLAISKNWNNLLYLHTVKVKKPIEAAFGIIAPQPLYNLKMDESNPSDMILKGGGKQYVITLFSKLLEEKRYSEITNYVISTEFSLFADTSWYQRFVNANYKLIDHKFVGELIKIGVVSSIEHEKLFQIANYCLETKSLSTTSISGIKDANGNIVFPGVGTITGTITEALVGLLYGNVSYTTLNTSTREELKKLAKG